MPNLDTSNELQLYRAGNGIKLIRPESSENSSQYALSNLFQLPLSVYLIDANSINQNVNEQDALLCGFDSVKNSVGKLCFSKFTKESAAITTKNDNEVMRTQTIKISEEDVVLSKGNISRPTLSIKLPWYNDDNKVNGIFGCSIILGQHPLASSLALISKLGFLNTAQVSHFIGAELNNIYLSKRQLSCAEFLLKGMTSKQIATQLNLSPRTIETYIEILKNKFQCHNKTELILKLSNYMAMKIPELKNHGG